MASLLAVGGRLAFATAIFVAATSLVLAAAARPARWVLALIVAAFALWLAGVALEALGAAMEPGAESPAAPARPGDGRWGADGLLRRHPRATLGWLRERLGLGPEAFAAHLGASPERVGGWESLGRAIEPRYRRRLLPLLARHLATPEGEAFARSLGQGDAAEG